jgi:hypothetical protein
MKTLHSPIKQTAAQAAKSGNTLIVVVFVILVTSFVLATLFASSRQRTFVLGRQAERLRALVIAETGLHQAFRVLSEDGVTFPEGGGMLLPGTAFSGGTYTVHISEPPGADEGVWLLRSTGVYRRQNREVAALVARGRPQSIQDENFLVGPLGNAALLAGGQLILGGNAVIDIGNNGAHANGSIRTNGGPTLIAGFLTSNGEIRTSNNTDLGGLAPADFVPDTMGLPPLNVQAFREYAIQNGSFHSGDYSPNDSHVTPAGGVLFVDGDVRLNAGVTVNGTIIATGNITINGGAYVLDPGPFPAVVSTSGNIRINGGATIGGWVYAMNGNVNGNGGADALVGVVAAGNIDLSGGYSLADDADPDSFTWPDRDDDDDGDNDQGRLMLLSWMR